MIGVAHAISLSGIDGVSVKVEAKLGSGLVSTTIVGLADATLRESQERLRAALHSCQLPPLNRRLTISLSPASVPKNGSSFDLPIAVAVLVARGFLQSHFTKKTVFAAELGLDGSVRPAPGTIAQVWAARQHGFDRIIVAAQSLSEAQEVTGIQVFGCTHLRELLYAFGLGDDDETKRGWPVFERGCRPTENLVKTIAARTDESPDLGEVRGQPLARQACLVAAAGGHHLLLHGEAGSGKTMLAERLPGLLPQLSGEDAMILAAMRSASDRPDPVTLNYTPPALVVGPTTTVPAMVGGGPRQVRPGLVSLAHGGVLVLNEAPDFSAKVLDALRGPLDTGEVTLRRAAGAVTFPAKFQLVMTANPCPCGKGTGDSQCACSPMQVRRYRQRISGPLLDRVDLQVSLQQPDLAQIESDRPISSQAARESVHEGRDRAKRRWGELGYSLNSEVPGRVLRADARLPKTFRGLLERSVAEGKLSLRGADRILRVAWTVADLSGNTYPSAEDLSLALQLRTTGAWGSA